MRLFSKRNILVGIGLAAILSIVWQAQAEQPKPTQTISVTKTCNDAPFDYQMRELSKRMNFCVYRLTYPSPIQSPQKENNTIPADYYMPNHLQSGLKYPAVIYLHSLDGNEQLTDMVCSVLASRGLPTISFKMPYYGERGGTKGPEAMIEKPSVFLGAVMQVGQDIRRTIDLLASRPEINPDRIGVAGLSLGGLTAAAAAGNEPRLYRATLMLAGGDLLSIIRHAHETRLLSDMLDRLSPEERTDVEAKINAADPMRCAAALRDRAMAGRVLMINAGIDEVIPRANTEKLANALGILDRVVWFDGLGHYTMMAELPRALKMAADFFAQDLPKQAQSNASPDPKEPDRSANFSSTPLGRIASLAGQMVTMLTVQPEPGHCHYFDVEFSGAMNDGKEYSSHVRFVRGTGDRFSLQCRLPVVGEIALGQNDDPWMVSSNQTVFVGSENSVAGRNGLAYVDSRHTVRCRMAMGIAGGIVMAPELLQQWITAKDDPAVVDGSLLYIAAKDRQKAPGELQIRFAKDNQTLTAIEFNVGGAHGKLDFRGWKTNAVASESLFDPPKGLQRQKVEQADLHRIFGAMLNFAAERLDQSRDLGPIGQSGPMKILSRDPAGHGLLCQNQGKLILFVSGTPQQMGAAQGAMLAPLIRMMTERSVYLVGGADSFHSGRWFFDTMADVARRTSSHIPPRFLEECDALGQAAGVSQRDARYANLFPERFHCSGVAVRGKATVGGHVIHARVLDYMRDIDLQDAALVTVFMPEGRHAWMSLGYAGFIGTVTAMNEKGLAIGEMGGRGEGQWDGIPMSLLMRDIMERAATAEEAVKIFRESPRTCEYYYVVSDKSGVMRGLRCTPEEVTVLEPGQQDSRLPHVPEDTVLISGDDRAKLLSQRIQENFGRIDPAKMMEIIKRPVAMQGNLHDAVFAPETLEMWFSDAGKFTVACDEPYAHVNLRELIDFYNSKAHIAQKDR
jgi:dienelactone hydrolase